MDLVDDQHVVAARNLRVWREHLSQQPHPQFALEPIDRDDEPWEVPERVRADAARAPQLPEQLPVDDPELEPESLAQLVAPLELQRSGTDDQRGARAVTQQQLLHDQAGFNGLTEANIVGDKQRRTWHPQRPYKWLKLVVLDRDAAAEGRLQGPLVSARDRAPTDGVKEGVEFGWIVELVLRNRGKGPPSR